MNRQTFFLLLLNISVSLAYPYEGFPFSEQLPDIARVGEDYEFVMNSQTFKSDNDETIQYEAYNLPSWLTFDTSSLQFSGSPTDDDDTGKLNFILQGTDSQGSLNQSCSIYLSDQPSPQLNSDDLIISQLEDMGTTNGYNGIVLDPETSFTLKFDSDTFELPSSSENSIVAYYGKSSNRTSLPSWCFFDSDSLTFSGTTPAVNSENAPSLEFELTLIATDYSGYSAVYSDFQIIVGGHTLYLNTSDGYNNTVTTNAGDDFSIDLPLDDVYLDGNVINSDDIGNIEVYGGPSWVEIDDNSKLSGTVPDDQTSNIVVNVTLYDTYGDSVFMDFYINVVHEIFSVDSLSNVTVNDGTFLQYTLPSSYFTNESATDIDVTFDETWLTFYHSNNTFTGNVPRDFKNALIEIDASINSLSETKSFYMIGKPKSSSSRRSSSTRSSSMRSSSSARSSSISRSSTKSHLPSATISISSTISSSSGSSSIVAATSSSSPTIVSDNSNANNKKKLAIGLGVAIPLFFILFALIIIFFCCCGKRRKNKNDDNEKNNDNSTNGGGAGAAPYMMKQQSSSNTTVTSARMLAEKNLTNLEKGTSSSDQSSYYSVAQSTLTGSDHNLYQAAKHQYSTDALLGAGGITGTSGSGSGSNRNSNTNSGIFNSWRKSSVGNNLQARDSLSSLATVGTNEFLTVNMINENKLRKSQMIFPKMSKLRNINRTSDSMFDSSGGSNPNNETSSSSSLREEDDNNIINSRDGSSNTISSEAQLVGFENSGSASRKIQREKKSFRAELYNINDDEFDSSSN